MNLSIPSYVAGPFFLIILFALCALAVIGAETALRAIKKKFAKPEPKPEPPKTPRPRRARTATVKPKAVRSIEINPEEIDRIYVKKTG